MSGRNKNLFILCLSALERRPAFFSPPGITAACRPFSGNRCADKARALDSLVCAESLLVPRFLNKS